MLTVPQVAARLNVSQSLVYALVDSGKIVSHRIGNGRGTVRISEADLATYLDSCRREKRERKPARRPRLKHLKV